MQKRHDHRLKKNNTCVETYAHTHSHTTHIFEQNTAIIKTVLLKLNDYGLSYKKLL